MDTLNHILKLLYKNSCSLLFTSLIKVKMHCPASNYPISREFTLMKKFKTASVLNICKSIQDPEQTANLVISKMIMYRPPK